MHSPHVGDGQLSPDERELITLVRAGRDDVDARTQAHGFLDGMWASAATSNGRGLPTAVLLALGAAACVKLPALAGMTAVDRLDEYASLVGLLIMPWVFAVFALGRVQTTRAKAACAALLIVSMLFVRLFPFADTSSTRILTAMHLPVVLWLAAGAWRASGVGHGATSRLGFVRLTAAALLYFALAAVAGGLVTALGISIFSTVSAGAVNVFAEWVVPMGAAAAFVLAAWLADSGGSSMMRVASSVQRAFTPVVTVLMLAFIAIAGPGGFFTKFQRDQLAVYTALLVVVTALAAYAVADPPPSRDRTSRTLLLAMCATGVALDVMVLIAMVTRTASLGLTANRAAVAGLNVVLLVNLGALVVTHLRTRRGQGAGSAAWLARYLDVIAAWAALVAFALPIAFHGA